MKIGDLLRRALGKKAKGPEERPEKLVELGEEEKPKKEEGANFAAYNRLCAQRRAERLKERKERQCPRTIETLAEWNGGTLGKKGAFAMDAGLSKSLAAKDRIELTDEVLLRFDDYFIGWGSCAMLMQHWLINRACTIPAEDAIAPGWKLALAESREEDADSDDKAAEQKRRSDRLREMERGAKEMKLSEVCRSANIVKKVFGYSLVVPVFSVDVDMSEPFDIDKVPEGAYLGLKVVEPMWITPQFDKDAISPTGLRFYEPTWYMIAGSAKMRIHYTWCIKLINAPVMDQFKPTYFYGGVPLTQMIFRRVYAAEAVANEAPMLAMTKRTLVLKANIENMIANPQMFEERLRAFAEDRDNYAVAVVGENTDPQQFDVSLSDFDQLITTQFQLVAAEAQIPVTKLMKVQIKGFDSSGDYETNDYTQSLIAIQKNDFTPIIEFHNKLWSKSKYGEEVGVSVQFNEVDSPSAKESADIRFMDAQRDAVLIKSGVIAPSEARDNLRNTANSGYTTLAEELDDDFPELNEPEKETLPYIEPPQVK